MNKIYINKNKIIHDLQAASDARPQANSDKWCLATIMAQACGGTGAHKEDFR